MMYSLKKIIWSLTLLLPSLCSFGQLPELIPQTRHADSIVCLTQDQKSSYIFTADKLGLIKQWSVKSNKLIDEIDLGLSGIDFLADISITSKTRLAIGSSTNQKVIIYDWQEDTIVKEMSFEGRLRCIRLKSIGKEKTTNKYGQALIFFNDTKRAYYDRDFLTLIDEKTHPFQGVHKFDVDEYATKLFVQEGQGIRMYKLFEAYRDARSIYTDFETQEEIIDFRYNEVFQGTYKNLLLAVTDSFYIISNPIRGNHFKMDRYVKRNADLRMIDKTMFLPSDQEWYHFKYENLGFIEKNNRVVLGEYLIDLNPFKIVSMNMPKLDFITTGYKNHGQQDVVYGVEGNALKSVYVGENDSREAIILGGEFEQPTKLFYNKYFNYLYSFTDKLQLWNLSETKLQSEVFSWTTPVKHLDLSDGLSMAAFYWPSKESVAQVYDFNTNSYKTAIPYQADATFRDISIDGNGFYTATVWDRKVGNMSIFSLWNNTRKMEHSTLEVENLTAWAHGSYGNEWAVCNPEGIKRYSYPDFKKGKKLQLPGVEKMLYAGEYTDTIVFIKNQTLWQWARKSKKPAPFGNQTNNGSVQDLLPIRADYWAALNYSKGFVLDVYRGIKYVSSIPCGAAKPVALELDEKRQELIVASSNGVIRFVDLEEGNARTSLISHRNDIPSYVKAPDKVEYLFYTPDNYYVGTRNIYDLVGVKHGNEVYSLTHYAHHYNNPLRVMDALQATASQHYNMMTTVMSKRTGQYDAIPDSIFDIENIPSVTDLSDSTISRTTDDTLNLFIGVESRLSDIQTIYVYQNGVPVIEANQDVLKKYIEQFPTYSDVGTSEVSGFTDLAVMLRNLGNSEGMFDNTLRHLRFRTPIFLGYGMNQIEVYCENEKGLRSRVKTYEVEKINRKKTKLHLIVLSTSKYENTDYNLKYAVKDGRDILAAMRDNYLVSSEVFLGNSLNRVMNYDTIVQDSLFDEKATRENFLALKPKLAELGPDDAVILFVSGHGVLDDNLDFWYAGHDMDFDNPAKNGISYEMINDLLISTRALQRVLLLDACHSGEVDKSQSEGVKEVSSPLVSASFRGASVEAEDDNGIGLQESFNLMKELFDEAGRNSGIQVISAASGDSYAFESPEWQNGVFTYSILEALREKPFPNADINRDKMVSVSELYRYTSTRVEELTDGAQKPTGRQISHEFDFRVW